MLTVKFQGAKELEKAMMELKTATAKRVARKVLKNALEPVRDRAETLAPEAEGDLAASISISSKARRRRQQQGRVEVYVGVPTSQGQVGSNQEYGNVNHAAQPFMRPAWQPLRFKVLDDVGANMMVEVKKSAARARKRAMKK